MPFGTRSVSVISPDGFTVNSFLGIILPGGTHVIASRGLKYPFLDNTGTMSSQML
jgi:hypothetical protein